MERSYDRWRGTGQYFKRGSDHRAFSSSTAINSNYGRFADHLEKMNFRNENEGGEEKEDLEPLYDTQSKVVGTVSRRTIRKSLQKDITRTNPTHSADYLKDPWAWPPVAPHHKTLPPGGEWRLRDSDFTPTNTLTWKEDTELTALSAPFLPAAAKECKDIFTRLLFFQQCQKAPPYFPSTTVVPSTYTYCYSVLTTISGDVR